MTLGIEGRKLLDKGHVMVCEPELLSIHPFIFSPCCSKAPLHLLWLYILLRAPFICSLQVKICNCSSKIYCNGEVWVLPDLLLDTWSMKQFLILWCPGKHILLYLSALGNWRYMKRRGDRFEVYGSAPMEKGFIFSMRNCYCAHGRLCERTVTV